MLLLAATALAWPQEAPRRYSVQGRYALFEQNLKRRAGEIAVRHLSEGGTTETMQVWDILRSIDYLTEVEGLRLSSVSLFEPQDNGSLVSVRGRA